MKMFQMYPSPARLAALLFIISISHSFAQTNPCTGRVVDAMSHQPLRDVVVSILETGEKHLTDAHGRFCFDHLSPGQYTIAVHHIAYADAERRIIVAEQNSDTVVFVLQPAILRSREIIVQSTRTTSEGLAPYPVDVMNSSDLTDQSHLTLPDALTKASGIYLVRDGPWETALSIRGLSRSNIVTLVDNVRIETSEDIAGSLSLVSLDDLERAEVIKSPGSSLYGSSAIGGVVHLVTKRASFNEDGWSAAEYTAGASSVDGGIAQHASFEHSGETHALRIAGGL